MSRTFRKILSAKADPADGFRGTFTEYEVYEDGRHIGNVWKVRAFGDWSGSSSSYGTGWWGWAADGAPELDYPTRAAAVAEMVVQ